MRKNNLSRMLPILLIVVVVIIAVAAIVMIFKNSSGGGKPDQPKEEQADKSQQQLIDTSAKRGVRLTVRGQLVSDEDFNSYQLTITPNSRKIELFSGYLDRPLEREDLPNNTKAYEEFVYALARAKMMDGEAFQGEDDDTRGICAAGNVYIFEILNEGKTDKRLWTSTCKLSKGSLTASYQQLHRLFLNQMPNSEKLVKKIVETKKF